MLSTQLHWSIFGSKAASVVQREEADWFALIEKIKSAGPFEAKANCPWVKLAIFGEVRTPSDSLRHDANVVAIYGVEGDYDGEIIQPEEAMNKLERAGVKCAVYTSPSHTPEKPRWRVLAPLSKEHPPTSRYHLLSRINGVLGGVLSGESFALSQSYYFGQVKGKDYRVLVSFDDADDGTCVDDLNELDAVAIGKADAVSDSNDDPDSKGWCHEEIAATVAKLGRKLKTGDGRRQLMLRAGNSLSANGVRDADTVMLVLTSLAHHYFDAADPPVEADLRGIAEHAVLRDKRKSEQIQREVDILLASFGKIEDVDKETGEILGKGSQDELVVMPFGELLDNPPPEPETFWGRGVFFRGARLLIGGAPKVGKSRFYLALAVAAATGKDFLGIRFEKPLRVMWVQAEIHLSFVHERIEALATGLADDDYELLAKNLIVTGRLDLDLTNQKDLAAIDRAIEKHQPDVLCFDPVINFSTADENKNTEVRALLRAVDSLGAKYNTATVLVHHTRKDAVSSGSGGGAGASFESVRGASAFRGWYDTGILLGGDSSNTTVAFECRNAKAQDNLIASFHECSGTYQVSDLTEPAQTRQNAAPMANRAQVAGGGDRVGLILGLLGQFPDGLMAGDFKNRIHKAFNISPRTSARNLADMVAGGLLSVEKRGANLAIYKVAKL